MKPLITYLLLFTTAIGIFPINCQSDNKIFETNLKRVSCEIVNDTLHVKGKYVSVVLIKNMNTSRGDALQEIDTDWFMMPLSNLKKGLYSLKIKGYTRPKPHDNLKPASSPTIYFKNDVEYNYKEVDYLEGYYYRLEKPKSAQEAKANRPKIVELLVANDIDYNTKNGRHNVLTIWKINNGIKTPINLRYETP